MPPRNLPSCVNLIPHSCYPALIILTLLLQALLMQSRSQTAAITAECINTTKGCFRSQRPKQVEDER